MNENGVNGLSMTVLIPMKGTYLLVSISYKHTD